VAATKRIGTNGSRFKEAPDPAYAGGGIQITAPRIETLVLKIRGTSPLIVHRFSAVTKSGIAEKQAGKKTGPKKQRDPKAEFKGALYELPGKRDRYGFPASGVKKAMVSACSFVDGATKKFIRGALFVVGDLIEIEGSKPVMRTDVVRIGPYKVADLRYRPQFTDWAMKLPIRYDADLVTREQLVALLARAGLHVGLGEWRPEKDGSFGMFEVESA